MSDTATRTRAPRGTKSVSDAFFAALRDIPEARRTDVARAAQIAIRDELKVMRDKAKAAATRAKKSKVAEAPVERKTASPTGKKPVAKKSVAKATGRAKRVMSAEA